MSHESTKPLPANALPPDLAAIARRYLDSMAEHHGRGSDPHGKQLAEMYATKSRDITVVSPLEWWVAQQKLQQEDSEESRIPKLKMVYYGPGTYYRKPKLMCPQPALNGENIYLLPNKLTSYRSAGVWPAMVYTFVHRRSVDFYGGYPISSRDWALLSPYHVRDVLTDSTPFARWKSGIDITMKDRISTHYKQMLENPNAEGLGGILFTSEQVTDEALLHKFGDSVFRRLSLQKHYMDVRTTVHMSPLDAARSSRIFGTRTWHLWDIADLEWFNPGSLAGVPYQVHGWYFENFDGTIKTTKNGVTLEHTIEGWLPYGYIPGKRGPTEFLVPPSVLYADNYKAVPLREPSLRDGGVKLPSAPMPEVKIRGGD
jgi:hypothetical protein